MGEIDLKKCVEEVAEMRLLPPIPIKIPVLAAMTIVGYIQLATRTPVVRDSEWARMAIDVARELQKSLDPNTENYKLLDFGWELECDPMQAQELLKKFLDSSLQDVPNDQM